MSDKETFQLYDGQVVIEFSGNPSHRYRVSEEGSKFSHVPSVTTILNSLAKPALIPWNVKVCCDYIYDNLQSLLEGDSFSVEKVFKIIEQAREAPEYERRKAAEIGTAAHDYLESYWLSVVRKTNQPELPEEGPVRNCVDAAMSWIKDHDMVPILFERPFYSRLHQFTGKEDFVGMVDGHLAVIDYKSSKQIYPETALQTAAYAKMYEEEFGHPVTHRWALKLGKYDGKVEPKPYSKDTLEPDYDTFLAVFKIYDRLKHLRRKPKPETEEKVDLLAGL